MVLQIIYTYFSIIRYINCPKDTMSSQIAKNFVDYNPSENYEKLIFKNNQIDEIRYSALRA